MKEKPIQWRCKSQAKFLPATDLKWTEFRLVDATKAAATVRSLNKQDRVFEYRVKP
jgi:hypothetical protein